MNKTSRVKTFKYQLQTIGAVLTILRLTGEISLSWFIVFSPFMLLFVFEAVFLAIGLIGYHIDKRKYDKL